MRWVKSPFRAGMGFFHGHGSQRSRGWLSFRWRIVANRLALKPADHRLAGAIHAPSLNADLWHRNPARRADALAGTRDRWGMATGRADPGAGRRADRRRRSRPAATHPVRRRGPARGPAGESQALE